MLSLKLTIQIILFCIFMLGIIVYLVHRNLFTIKYSLIWLISIMAFLLSALIPNFLGHIRLLLGFELMSNMFFSILIGMLMFFTLSLTVIVSKQKESIRLLTQEISIIKAMVNKNDK